MEEQLISFETAKLAKEKGFGGKGLTTPNGYFRGNNLCNIPCNNKSDFCGKDEFSAPTQSLLQKWLREKHNIDIQVLGLSDHYYVGINKKGLHECSQYFYPNIIKYEDNLEIGLLESLKLI